MSAINSQLAPRCVRVGLGRSDVPYSAGSRFYWVRTWDAYNGWSTFYEGWSEPLANDFRGRTQAGALVIADIFDTDQGRWVQRETWQQYDPNPGRGGTPRSVEYESAPPLTIDAPPPPAPGDWKPLAVGGDVPIKKGYWYRSTASVKSNHSQADVLATLKGKGLEVVEYKEAGTGSYKTVNVTAYAVADGGSLPTKVPWPASAIDDTHLTKLEYAATSGKPAISTSSASSPWPWIIGVPVVGGLAYGGYRWWKRRRA